MKKRYNKRTKNSYKTAFFGMLILCLSIIINTENDISKTIHNTVQKAVDNVVLYENTAIKVGLSFADIKTEFKSPIENPIITSAFGQRTNPVTKLDSFHYGIDLDTFDSQNVKSIADGKILLTDYDEINGNYILIAHENGYESVYAHLSEIIVTQGEVKQGEIIGVIGDTGMSTGTHLHLEILENGEHINPQTVINFYEN